MKLLKKISLLFFLSLPLFTNHLFTMERDTKNNVVLCGMHNVLFDEVKLPWLLRKLGATPQTFLNLLYKDLREIPPYEIPAQTNDFPVTEEPPLVLAWITSRISNEEAKRITLEHTKWHHFIARAVAKSMFTPQEVVKEFHTNEAVVKLVEECTNHGTATGLCASFNGDAYDALVIEKAFLRTAFSSNYEFISGKIGKDTSDPAFYDTVQDKCQDQHVYLIDAPGPALSVAAKKGITSFTFETSKPHAIDYLEEFLKNEGLLKKNNHSIF